MSQRTAALFAIYCLAGTACVKDEASVPSGTPDAASVEPEMSASAAPPAPRTMPAPPDVGAAPTDAKKSASGLAWIVLTPGAGHDHPGPDDRVKVHYTGWTKSGAMFDSSVLRGQPLDVAVAGVIPGWTEGLQQMVAGEKRRFWVPAALAYGDHPRAGAPIGDLVFDMELLEVIAHQKPPPVPPDLKAAPASATKTASGLAMRVLEPGTGTAHPTATSTVIVNYTGWTKDGKMFDSTITRGEPARFGLDQVIKGWTEGVQLMVKGEKARFWVPARLAYGDKPERPGAPAGPLVFEIELVDLL